MTDPTPARHDEPFDMRSNPVDPDLSADVGRERRRWMVPLSIAVALFIAAAAWWLLFPHGPSPPQLTFDNRELGCRFTYSSKLSAGPNFVRAPSGSLLTIERHSLYQAQKDFVAGLPDDLMPQVMIQINENYEDVSEVSRSHPTVDGRKGLEVVLRGKPRSFKGPTFVTITIFANDDWVYVLRSYSEEALDAAERPLFRQVRETWRFQGS